MIDCVHPASDVFLTHVLRAISGPMAPSGVRARQWLVGGGTFAWHQLKTTPDGLFPNSPKPGNMAPKERRAADRALRKSSSASLKGLVEFVTTQQVV